MILQWLARIGASVFVLWLLGSLFLVYTVLNG